MSRIHGLWRRTAVVVFLFLLIPLLTACPEPKDINKLWEECIEFAIDNTEDSFDECVERSETILDACLDAADDDEEDEKKCRKEHAERLKECDKAAKEIEAAKREHCKKLFEDQDLVNRWLTGTNADRTKIKEKAIEALKAIASGIIGALKFSVDAGASDRIERQAIAALAVDNLVPPGAFLEVMAVGLGEGMPDPTAPSSITFVLDPYRTWANVVLTESQEITVEGGYTLDFLPPPDGMGPFQVSIADLELTAGSLTMGAVDTGAQRFALSPYLPNGGIYDPIVGYVDLFAPLLASSDLVPTGSVGLELALMGEMNPFGPLTQLTLTLAVPLNTIFTLDEPAPPLTMAATFGPEGGELSLDGLTGLQVPPGALSSPLTITLRFFPREILPNVCALPAEPGDPVPSQRCINHAFDLAPEGLLLSKPATLTLGYNIGLFANMFVDLAMPYVYDGVSGTWTPIPDYHHDLVGQFMAFPVDHFSRYGIGAPRQVHVYLPVVLKE